MLFYLYQMGRIWKLYTLPYCKQNHFYGQMYYIFLSCFCRTISLSLFLTHFVSPPSSSPFYSLSNTAVLIYLAFGIRSLFGNIITFVVGLKWCLGSGCIVGSNVIYLCTHIIPSYMMGSISLVPFQVEFSADTLRLNLIDLARTGSKFIQVAGRVAYTCPAGDPQDPVTFTTRDSHLVSI